MRIGRFLIAGAAAASLALVTPGAATANGEPTSPLVLGAGSGNPFTETIDVNVVLVGIEEADLGRSSLPDLPATVEPAIRYKLFYDPSDSAGAAELGLEYSLTYNHVFADDGFEGALAAYLTSIADDEDPTLFQGPDFYGSQTAPNTVEITDNAWIDAPSTEAWLAANAGSLGVDPRSPTVFFLDVSGIGNHVYVNTAEADPDTGYNFGEIRASRKMTAWGGTPDTGNRVWFYDLSAGPEGWSDNWNVDDADVDGDGAPDYRIPPIWHYTGSPKAYEHPGFGAARLATDLGLVTRYVATNLLFASSPLYPPYLTANDIPETVELDLNVVDWWKRADVANQFVKPDVIQSGVDTLPSGREVTVSSDVAALPFSGDWARCYQGFASYNKLCYSDLKKGLYDPFANLFLSAARNQGAFLDDSADYEAALIGYGLGNRPKNPQGLLGFADDNWIDGTQSGVFSFVYPDVVAVGYGMTTTMIHEYGHHSSMSHPHDGYDSASGLDYGPEGDHYFAWLGDMSHTIMSYMDLALDFGQFDQDNSARHHAAGYAKVANALAAQNAGDYGVANDHLAAAQAALAGHDYPGMLEHAKAAYDAVVAEVEGTGGTIEVVEPSTWTLQGPFKPGNGPAAAKAGAYARDLDEGHNVKRVYSE